MKKLTLFLSCLLFLSCGGDSGGDGNATTSEYLNVTDIDLYGDATTVNMNIQASNNCQWVISWTDSWIRSVSPTTGRGNQNVNITVDVNPSSTASRTAVIKVSNTSGSIVRNITLTQSPNKEYLDLSVYSMEFTSSAESRMVTVSSNTTWSVTGEPNWIKLNVNEGRNNGSINITVDANPTEIKRDAVLTFTGREGTSKQLNITQAGSTTEFDVSPKELSAPATASTVSFNVTGDVKWTAASNCSWATLAKEDMSGEGTKTLTVTLEENTTEEVREAEITVSASGKKEIVKIIQAGSTIELEVSPKELSAPATASTVSFNIISNVKWTAESNSSWATLAIEDMAGQGTKTLTVSLADNTTEQVRETEITVSASGKKGIVTISQAAGSRPVIKNVQVTNKSTDESTISFTYESLFTVTEYGVCYALTDNPTVNDNRKYVTGNDSQGTPSIKLTGLTPGTTYYVRAYAINAVGIQYSKSISFTTGSNWPENGDNITPN